MITFAVDWLRWTELTPENARIAVEKFEGVTIGDRQPGRGVYTDGVQILLAGRNAGIIEWSSAHPEFKASITLSGLDVLIWRSAGALEDLVHWLVSTKAKVTRLDLAIDVLDDERATVSGLATEWRAGVKTRARTGAVIESRTDGEPGETVYVGSRQSDKFLRIYNKAAEMGQKRDWTRLELECKGKYAMSVLNSVARLVERQGGGSEKTMDALASIAKGEIRRYVSFGAEWWRDALADETEYSVSVERKRNKSEKWAWTTLLAMVENAADEYPGWREHVVRQLGGNLTSGDEGEYTEG